ncbi:hypothetical protein KIN20_032678 [Parelaphostrongylus tenuis]|uniref:Uncharacterized protein n=1 Tax=Parelaphostrongylus tenuis TaxID=148309 RepID=A0AAD5R996_PARTN|nr:hypothetical protein KIN20_032678 [Parelaphostrongylus tenuis]
MEISHWVICGNQPLRIDQLSMADFFKFSLLKTLSQGTKRDDNPMEPYQGYAVNVLPWSSTVSPKCSELTLQFEVLGQCVGFPSKRHFAITHFTEMASVSATGEHKCPLKLLIHCSTYERLWL